MPSDDRYTKEKQNQSPAEHPSPTTSPEDGPFSSWDSAKQSLDEEAWQGRGCRGQLPGGGNTLTGGVKR